MELHTFPRQRPEAGHRPGLSVTLRFDAVHFREDCAELARREDGTPCPLDATRADFPGMSDGDWMRSSPATPPSLPTATTNATLCATDSVSSAYVTAVRNDKVLPFTRVYFFLIVIVILILILPACGKRIVQAM